MKLNKAIKLFRDQTETLIEQGHHVHDVTVEKFVDDQLLVCGNNAHGDADVTVGVDRDNLLIQIVEYIFLITPLPQQPLKAVEVWDLY